MVFIVDGWTYDIRPVVAFTAAAEVILEVVVELVGLSTLQ
jgi:hypothetical protein